MILYFDSDLKLKTIIPHGEVPRQYGNLEISVLLNKNFNKTNKIIGARYKSPGSLTYSSDIWPTAGRTGVTYTFEKINGENIGSLIDEEEYIEYHFNLTGTTANDKVGNLQVQLTLYQSSVENNETVLSKIKQFGNATIYIEKTLGIAPDEGVGMTRSEYENVILHINGLNQEISDINTEIVSINNNINLLEKATKYLGEYPANKQSDLYADVFEEIYTNNSPLVTAVFNNNLVMFMKSDNANKQYVYYINCSDYKIYKLKLDGTTTELYLQKNEVSQVTLTAATTALNNAVAILNQTISSLSDTVTSNRNHCDTQYSAALGYVDNKIAALVGAAPEQLDTIVELANQISSMIQTDSTLLAFMQNVQTNFVTNDLSSSVSITANNNTDYTLTGESLSLISIIVPETITTGYASSLHWVNPSDVPVINITNNSNYDMKFLVNNVVVSSISLEKSNGIVNCLIMLEGNYLIVRIEELE